MAILLFLAVLFLAYSNGANDNFKGVASLYGSKTTSYRVSLWWATLTTSIGSVFSFFLANGMLERFSGKGIVPSELAGSETFLFAVAFGAATTVIIATVTGFPVSTTHGLTGAILGAGIVSVGTGVNLLALQTSFLVPLLLSPVLAVAGASLVYWVLHYSRKRFGISSEACLCIGREFVPVTAVRNVLACVSNEKNLSISVDDTDGCVQRYDAMFFGASVQTIVDYGHFLSAGVVSFARGINDTPKIAALLLLAGSLDLKYGWVLVAIMMAAGGIYNSRRVAEKMSNDITDMNSGQAFSANLATGLVVISASLFGLPVSTTHVSVGSIFGVGSMTKRVDMRVVTGILLSWLVTLPLAASIAGLTIWLTGRF